MAYRIPLFASAATLALVIGSTGVSCSNRAEDCSEASTCPGVAEGSGASGGEGGADGGAGGDPSSAGASAGGGDGEGGGGNGAGGDDGGPCDLTRSPIQAACLIDEEHAVFVAPTGNDDDTGSRDAPVATLTRAIELAATEKIVLVCSGTYDEEVKITTGARIYGGFSCDDWSPSDELPSFRPSDEGFALEIDDVDDPVIIERVSFEVAAASDPGDSSVAAFVNSSSQVTLREVSLVAGDGATGKDGVLTAFEYAASSALDGNPEGPATMGGGEKTCACQDDLTSVGGLGGMPAASGDQGTAGLPSRDGPGGEPGTAGAACNSGGGGGDGADALPTPSAPGAADFGSALPNGWNPRDGSTGGVGHPGQGGGGGASRTSAGHGGGGGCGGCGGNGGKGGQGGGGSIALLLIDSPVTLEACSLDAGDAGHGGKGAAGQVGQQDFGSGGLPVSTVNSCAGGNGGKGGNGGAGGGGAGGVSAGILWKGDLAPSVSGDTSITHGDAGLAGAGGALDNAGVEGKAQKILAL